MKISEYINELKIMQADHGDLECEDSYGDPIGLPELNDDDDTVDPVYVLADKA